MPAIAANLNQPSYTLLLKHDSEGRVLDAGLQKSDAALAIQAGDKIAQMSPFQAMTHFEFTVVEELSPSPREAKGFGSSGR
jgi:dUTP pyrophosphatase